MSIKEIVSKKIHAYMHNKFQGVHMLDRIGSLSSTQMEALRKTVGVLLVDDMDSEAFAETLSEQGFSHVKPVKKIPSDATIQSYQIIITDVDGVAKDNSNGLKVARHIKERNPLKQVIISSGQLNLSEYRKDLYYLNMFDGVYDKIEDNEEQLAKLIDQSIVNLYHPSFVWRNFRKILLTQDGGQPEMDIFSVMEMEDKFVRKILAENPHGIIETPHLLDNVAEILNIVGGAISTIANVHSIIS